MDSSSTPTILKVCLKSTSAPPSATPSRPESPPHRPGTAVNSTPNRSHIDPAHPRGRPQIDPSPWNCQWVLPPPAKIYTSQKHPVESCPPRRTSSMHMRTPTHMKTPAPPDVFSVAAPALESAAVFLNPAAGTPASRACRRRCGCPRHHWRCRAGVGVSFAGCASGSVGGVGGFGVGIGVMCRRRPNGVLRHGVPGWVEARDRERQHQEQLIGAETSR